MNLKVCFLSSVTSECTKKEDEVFDRQLSVVDTPGLFDTSQEDRSVMREISKCINMSAPGPHAFLLVIKVGPFSAEERDAVKKVQEIFGENAWKYTMILFTHGDAVKKSFSDMLKRAPPELTEILEKVGHRSHVFNNLKTNDRGQVLELLEKVDEMVSENGGKYYSNPTYLEVTEMLNERESKLKAVYQKKLDEEIKAVESKYRKKLSEMKKEDERKQVEKQRKAELNEMNRFYKRLQNNIRSIVEKMLKEETVGEISNKLNEKLKLS